MARIVNEIIVHCAATKPSMDIGAEEIRGWHVEGNGWSDIGYHWVIRRDGTIEAGRPEDISGAHCKDHNSGSIGVCLVGGIDEAGDADANFTMAQYTSLKEVLNDIRMRNTITKLSGHRDYANKACPSFDVNAWYGEL